ncbi:MAG: biopolymer transporter ExbD [Gemmatimonadetes bacterium]|jgi:biopolymer transport protein TolR|nr:MAG: biopolymer transporter ExbD [Gemmatimonadota bacterium]
MAMAASSGSGVQSSPNVTPMIDVMLVLLIIFMVVTPALMAGFNADPPKAINLKDHPEDANLDQVLGIDRDGAYYLNKKRIRTEDVGPMIKRIFDARTEDKIMYLKADKGLDYSKVLDALDLAAKNGVRMTGMISEQRPGTISTVAGDTKASAPIGKAPAAGGKP